MENNDVVTIESLQEELQNARNEIDAFTKTIEDADTRTRDLETERDSLVEELNELKEKYTKQSEELTETKKLNFKLGRTIGVDTRSEEQIIEDTYREVFKNIR